MHERVFARGAGIAAHAQPLSPTVDNLMTGLQAMTCVAEISGTPADDGECGSLASGVDLAAQRSNLVMDARIEYSSTSSSLLDPA